MEEIREQVVNCIFSAIDIMSDRYKISKNPHSLLFGKGGSIDSLGLVSFIVAVEEEIEKTLKKKLTLADHKALMQKVYPFGSVDALSNYIIYLLNPDKEVSMPKKVVITDLDNTLWDGIAGEDGIEGIKIYGKYRELQESLKKLKESGVLLVACSKNNQDTAMNVIINHPDMVLRIDDFILMKIHWGQKSVSVEETAQELNLGKDSFVFIDDDPRERDAIKVFHPDVTVSEKLDESLFGTAVTQEDLLRVQMYKTEKDRQSSKATMDSMDDWLNSLETVVSVNEMTDINVDRVAQMINKTNQMNLSTRRLTKDEFLVWVSKNDAKVWVFNVQDKFGDAGIVGLITAVVEEDSINIVDFILSCRVMNRKVEETMAYVVVDYASKNQIRNIIAKYIQTPRNGPCLTFWKRSGFVQNGDTFTYSSKFENHMPSCIKLVEVNDGE
jgi:FkbH-like protein